MPGAKKYRRRDKRIAYGNYSVETAELKRQLLSGELKQDQFERAQEMLDDRYRGVR